MSALHCTIAVAVLCCRADEKDAEGGKEEEEEKERGMWFPTVGSSRYVWRLWIGRKCTRRYLARFFESALGGQEEAHSLIIPCMQVSRTRHKDQGGYLVLISRLSSARRRAGGLSEAAAGLGWTFWAPGLPFDPPSPLPTTVQSRVVSRIGR
jgi:hypothetical protein